MSRHQYLEAYRASVYYNSLRVRLPEDHPSQQYWMQQAAVQEFMMDQLEKANPEDKPDQMALDNTAGSAIRCAYRTYCELSGQEPAYNRPSRSL